MYEEMLNLPSNQHQASWNMRKETLYAIHFAKTVVIVRVGEIGGGKS